MLSLETRTCHRSLKAAAMLALAAVTAAPGAAAADDCCRWELKVQRTAPFSRSFTVELYAHFPDDKHAFAGGTLDIRTDGVNWTSIDLCGPPGHPGTTAGSIVGSDVIGIAVGQLSLPGIEPDPSNPILVWCGEFESTCGSFAVEQVWTETDRFAYFAEPGATVMTECTAQEASRAVFCMPLSIGSGWLAAPTPETGHRIAGSTLELFPRDPGSSFGASVGDETIDWTEPGASFGVEFEAGSLHPGAIVDFEWLPWFRCGLGAFRMRMIRTEAGALVVPDFSDAGLHVVPFEMYLGEKLVDKTQLQTGAQLAISEFCSDLVWSWEIDEFGRWVLVLRCEGLFVVEGPGGPARIDRLVAVVDLGPIGGLDRAMLIASRTDTLRVLDVGQLEQSSCYADCDGSGALDFFDFLCFQNQFAAGDPEADCDGSGQLDFFDFLCFQNEFAAGCP